MNLKKDLGVKGYCFRGYPDNPTVAAKVRECGVDCIDLSRSQLDFKNATLHEPAIEAYRSAGIRIGGIGVVPFDTDQVGETQYFEFCKKAGCRTISCTFAPETLDMSLAYVQRLCEQYDMRVAIHNHGGRDWLGNSRMLAHVLKKCGPRIGLCVDTAWCFHAGENPVQWLEKFSGQIYAIHYKDFLFGPKGNNYDVIVGKGCLDLKVFIQGLKAINFDGPAVIEYEGDVENPVPALQQCVHEMLNYL
jgi:sugar phosphate isomerase/epimerase